jgi:hypothetical protein
MAAHLKLAADFGHQADAVVRAPRERSQQQEKPVNSFERVRESLNFSRDKNFEREAVVDERTLIRDGLRRGMGEITHGQIRANLDTRLALGEFQIVERSKGIPGRQFTTAKTIEAEYEILRRMRAGQNHIEPVLSRPQAIAIADQHPHLNQAQKTVVATLAGGDLRQVPALWLQEELGGYHMVVSCSGRSAVDAGQTPETVPHTERTDIVSPIAVPDDPGIWPATR